MLLLAAGLIAVVIWALQPQQTKRAHHRLVSGVARVSPIPPAQVVTPLPSPPTASPLPSPSTRPAVPSTPQPSATVSANANGARVAVIIDDCGQWPATERGYLALPIPLTLSVLPHVRYTSEIAQEAASDGKGVMLHLPMEPLSHANPGPGEIKTTMSDDAVTKQTEDDVAQVPLARGVNNHEGSEASANARVMNDVMAVLKAHDLFFIDSRTSAASVGAARATDAGVPNASRDVFLDDQADVAYTETMLEQAVTVAQRNGSAIAIGHPKPTTLEALRQMYPKMQAQGVHFVLASELVR